MSHNWISTGDALDSGEALDSCLVCGGVWLDSHTGEVVKPVGNWVNFSGEVASSCTRNTSQCHHYSGECPEEVCNLDADCNCLFCV